MAALDPALSEPPRRITALLDFQAQGAGIRGDVGAALVDDADHAQGNAYPCDLKPVRAASNPPNAGRSDRRDARCLRARGPWLRSRPSSRRKRSSNAPDVERASASRMSASLAAKILGRCARNAAAAARSARFFCAVSASASTRAAARADRPMPCMRSATPRRHRARVHRLISVSNSPPSRTS